MHQEADGTWNAAKNEGAAAGSLGSSGLAVLALMSGGHTVRKGDYSRTVLKGLEAIMRHQNEEGHISDHGVNLYAHAICTIALAKAFGRARDERIGAAAKRAINFCEKAVAADGGWRYEPKPPASDMSVTAWFIQALKTAKISGLKTDDQIFNRRWPSSIRSPTRAAARTPTASSATCSRRGRITMRAAPTPAASRP